MHRVVASVLHCAFLHLQGVTCCHCRQSGTEENLATDAVASGCRHEHCPCEHFCNPEEPWANRKADDLPPCGPHHGTHLCVISHGVYVGPGPAHELNFDATVAVVRPHEPCLQLTGETVDSWIVNRDGPRSMTLFDRSTLLRI